jgi:DNA-directed RNA polymerase subunit RPC12/RpoP
MSGSGDHTTYISVLKEMQDTQERFFVFIGKLKDKMTEFAEASIPELIELNNSDPDEFKREYGRMKSAVLGQLDSIMTKARTVQEEKIGSFPFTSDSFEISKAYSEFRGQCYDKFDELENLCNIYRDKIEATSQEDHEEAYRKILEEHEEIRDKFRCVQCGSPVALEKIYFTTTYIACPACQTKNTFEPSSRAKMLEHVGRSLAEQRTAHLLTEYNEIPGKTQTLYLQRHALDLSLIHEKDTKIIRQKTAQIQELDRQRKELEDKAPVLYRIYLRAMFDEWNKINPDLAEEHEKFHNRILTDYNKNKTI